MSDIDAGFSPGLQKMRHECGGTWRIVRHGRPALPPELKRTARLSMRTYQDVADKAARVGTAAI